MKFIFKKAKPKILRIQSFYFPTVSQQPNRIVNRETQPHNNQSSNS